MAAPIVTPQGLTLKQERFAQAFVHNGGNSSAAYRTAYDCNNSSDETIHRKAHDVLCNGNVTARIQELIQAEATAAGITEATVLHRINEDRNFAIKTRNAATALRSDELLGKHIGMWPNKTELQVTGTVTHQLSEASVDELKAMLEDVRRQKMALSDTMGPVIDGESREIDSGT